MARSISLLLWVHGVHLIATLSFTPTECRKRHWRSKTSYPKIQHRAHYNTANALPHHISSYIDLGQPKSVAPGPGCSEPNNPGKGRILIWVLKLCVEVFCILSGLLFWVLIITIYTKQSSKQHLYRRKSYNSINFNPGLALTGYRTTRSSLQ